MSNTATAPTDRFPPTIYRCAQLLYASYLAETGGLNYRKEPCPQWDDLPTEIRDAWGVVAVVADVGIRRDAIRALDSAVLGDAAKLATFRRYSPGDVIPTLDYHG